MQGHTPVLKPNKFIFLIHPNDNTATVWMQAEDLLCLHPGTWEQKAVTFPVYADREGSHKCSQSRYHTHRNVAERCLW